MPAKKSGFGFYACICGIFLVILGFGLGFVIGFFVVKSSSSADEELRDVKLSAVENSTFLLNAFNRSLEEDLDEDFRRYKKIFEKGAGNVLANYTSEKFSEYELDLIEDTQFVVTKLEEEPNGFNSLKINDQSGKIIFEGNLSHVGPIFTHSAKVKGPPVYVNFARREDFDTLAEHNVVLKGRIFVARCCKIHLQNMIQNAEEYEPLALLIYEEQLNSKRNPYHIIPLTQSFTELYKGLLPGFEGQIPVQYLPYDMAQTIFRLNPTSPQMPAILEKWNYPISVGQPTKNESCKVGLNVKNKLGNRIATNVFGKIEGAVEPDRFVILGTYRKLIGSVDLDIGSKLLLKLAETFGGLKKEGWRPRRSLVFASFDAREFGVTAATDWLKLNSRDISSEAVVYINFGECKNIDETITSTISAVTTIYNSIHRSQNISQLLNASKSYSNEDVSQNIVKEYVDDVFLNRIQMPAGIADTSPFVYYSGIPAIDFSSSEVSCQINGDVNSTFDTYYRNLLSIILDFADSEILPLNLQLLALELSEAYEAWFSYDSHYKNVLYNYGIDINTLKKSINKFQSSVYKFHKNLITKKHLTPVTKRIISDKLLQVEKVLILDYNVERPFFRHSIFVPDHCNYLTVSGFQGIINAVEQFDESNFSDSMHKLEELVSDILRAINQATNILRSIKYS